MNYRVILSLSLRQSINSLAISEWRALLLSLVLAIAIASLMAVLGERIERTLALQGSALMGADLVLEGSRPLDPSRLETATKNGLEVSEVIQLSTMANSGENFLLVTVRTLSKPYPRGEIILQQPGTTSLPQPGEVWAEPALLERMNLKLGDQLTLGNLNFTLTAVIDSAPDRGRGFIGFNPQLIINSNQLKTTGLTGPGSRIHYRQMFAGDIETINQLEKQLREQLETGERLTAVQQQEGQRSSALQHTSSYLRLAALLAILISALTILLSLRRFIQGQNNRVAILKTLGLSNRAVLLTYLHQLFYAALFTSLLGLALTAILEQVATVIINQIFNGQLASGSAISYLIGPMTGFSILICLGLPALIQLYQSNPSQLLQSQTVPSSWIQHTPYLFGFILLLIVSSFYLASFTLTLTLTLSILGSALLIGVIGAYLVKQLSYSLISHHPLGSLLHGRVLQQQRWYRVQIPVICLLFALLSISYLALNDLLQRWQNQLPTDTPDHFLINIQSWERDDVADLMQQHQLNSPLWPIYRGRLVAINKQPLSDILSAEQLQNPALQRELNLTSAAEIPTHNKRVEGMPLSKGGVSVEQKKADELGLIIGDIVTFDVGGKQVNAAISSIRSLRWDSFQPNFFFIFAPNAIEKITPSYITSFHLGEHSATFSKQLLAQFPTLTLIDIRQILEQLQQLLSRLSLLSSLLMLLTLFSGLVLLYVTLTQELEQRRYENALLQTLGASEQQCRQLDRLEMGLVGGISGMLAVLISELALWQLHSRLLQLEATLHPMLWIVLPLGSAILFMLISSLSHRQQNLSDSYRTLLAR